MIDEPKRRQDGERSKIQQQCERARKVDASLLEGKLQRALRDGKAEDDVSETFQAPGEPSLARRKRGGKCVIVDWLRCDYEPRIPGGRRLCGLPRLPGFASSRATGKRCVTPKVERCDERTRAG